MDVKSIVATNLRSLREANNMTQAQVSEFVNIPFPTYRSWENSRSIPNSEMLPKICEFYGIPVSRLFVSEEELLSQRAISPQEALDVLQSVISSGRFQVRTTAPDVLDALANADEADLRSIRNILGLPIPKISQKAN